MLNTVTDISPFIITRQPSFQTRNHTDPVKDGTCAFAFVNKSSTRSLKSKLCRSFQRRVCRIFSLPKFHCKPSWAHTRTVRLQPVMTLLDLFSRLQNIPGSAHSWNVDLSHGSQLTPPSKELQVHIQNFHLGYHLAGSVKAELISVSIVDLICLDQFDTRFESIISYPTRLLHQLLLDNFDSWLQLGMA